MRSSSKRGKSLARSSAVHERRGQRLPVRGVGDLLDRRLPDALLQPAMDLPLDDDRIDQVAGIVDRHHLLQPRLAGLPVDLQHRDVAAERIGVVLRLEERLAAQSRGQSLGQPGRPVGVGGNLGVYSLLQW